MGRVKRISSPVGFVLTSASLLICFLKLGWKTVKTVLVRGKEIEIETQREGEREREKERRELMGVKQRCFVEIS
jgi:hypothetical protein